jgi:hypothetical protein
MQICFLNGIVGVTSLDPIMVPLVQSLGDLLLECALPMLVRVQHILAHYLKVDGIASSHFHVAPYHVHPDYTIS